MSAPKSILLLILSWIPVTAQAADITINPSTTYQTMRGWEVLNWGEPQLPANVQALIPLALDTVVAAGQNRIRLEVKAGSEHGHDNWGDWAAAGFPQPSPQFNIYKVLRYETENDNNDPNVINPAGFHWSDLDWNIEHSVEPLRQKLLAATGEKLYINLCYVGFIEQVTSGKPYVHANPAEYAEFMLALFQHTQAKYGWVPDAIEVSLEPEHGQPTWTGTYVGQAIAATGPRLAAAGYQPDFIAPSMSFPVNSVPYFDAMMAVPGVTPYLKEFSYHRYAQMTQSNLQTIASRARNAGIATSMLEWWDSGLYGIFHEDLKIGENGAWQQAGVLEFQDPNGIGTAYINPTNPNVATFTNPTKFTSLYYRWVRRGAVRIGATSAKGSLDPLAWRNKDGRQTVVIKASQGETITISGLPAGTYGIAYTLQFTNIQGTRSDQTIGAGGTITTDIPNQGVISIYAKTSGGGGNPCDLDGQGGVLVPDVQLCVNQVIGASSCIPAGQLGSGDIDRNGLCQIIDVQRVVNAVLGGACVSP